MGARTAVVVALLAAGMAWWLSSLYTFLSPPPGYTTNDKDCKLVGQGQGMIGSEDLALAKHSILLVTSGDLYVVFHEGSAKANPGGIWALDMRQGGSQEPIHVELKDFPTNRRFQPHGLDVSNSTNRLYAISHNVGHSSVDIFNIIYRSDCLSLPWKCNPVTLHFIHSISSSLFPLGGINDVAEVSDNQVYVTQWHAFPFPLHGINNPVTMMEKLQKLADPIIHLLGIKLTTVFLCRWKQDGKDVCTEATAQRFVGANGITISGDGSSVYVNDPSSKRISVMARDKATGSLATQATIPLPMAVDNIEHDDESGDIIMGTIPALIPAIKLFKGEKVPVPGGMLVTRKTEAGDWKVESVLEHDGTKLAQISAASRLGKRIVLGSPFSEGLLLCTV